MAILTCIAAGYLFFVRMPGAPASDGGSKTLLIAGSAGYVDSRACAGCHQKTWETYRRTGMGRSFARVHPDNIAQELARNSSFYHEPSDQYYSTYEKAGKYYQRRYQIGFGGKESNVVEKEIHFVVGSGNHVRTYLHKTPDGRIYELPAAGTPKRVDSGG